MRFYSPAWLRSDLTQVLAFVGLLVLFGAAAVAGAGAMPYRWQWHRVPAFLYREFNGAFYAGPLMKGLVVTLVISVWSFAVALLAGLVAALLRLSDSIIGRAVARGYIELVRNTPLLVQLYLFYFVLAPILGIDRQTTAILCLGLFEGSFGAEIIRAGILAIPRGQWEAAGALGLARWQLYGFVVLPQALRVMVPPITSLAISVVKHSAIVSAIAIFDLANEGRTIIADTFMTFEVWLTVAAIYLVVTTALSVLASWLERRYARSSS